MEVKELNAIEIENDIKWFEKVANASLTLYFNNESEVQSIYEFPAPEPSLESAYGRFIIEKKFGFEERLILILALIPIVKPQVLDVFQIKNQNLNTAFSEFGGIVKDGGPFLPTLETACFILTNKSIENKIGFLRMFTEDHFLFKENVLSLDFEVDTVLHQKLILTKEHLNLLLFDLPYKPTFGSHFPAKEISTDMKWEDLILPKDVKSDIGEIKEWLLHQSKILDDWKLSRNLKNGYRVLFYGPPGTGKTLAATLIGQETERKVYRVDLSMIVSKYIGETEKNLGKLFDEAENKDWILFFDEADSLFGKRSQTKGSNDRYANQEVAFLLQRIENYNGLVILATNHHSNLDAAFSRRFQSMILFPKPDKESRLQLWKNLFGEKLKLETTINLTEIAQKYELSGGEMINILRFCAIKAAKSGLDQVNKTDLLEGIKREYIKKNKTL